jgi:hypothetical protein
MDFLAQLIRRFLAQTPWFQKVVKVVMIITATVAAIPQFLDMAGLTTLIPGSVMDIVSKVVVVAALVGAFVAQLAVSDEGKEMAAKEGKPIITLESMKNIETLMPKSDFIRVHKSFIVSTRSITAVSGNTVELGTLEIPIGGIYKEALMDFLKT